MRVLAALCLGVMGSSASAAQPFAATQAPAPISEVNATLNGMATPNGLPTQAWFEWGTTIAYGRATAPVDLGAGSSVVRVSAPIGELKPGTVYHCRLVSSNQAGLTRGPDRLFVSGGIVEANGSGSGADLPCGRLRAVAVAAGGGGPPAVGIFGGAVTPAGDVVVWGTPLLAPPVGLGQVIALSAGDAHLVALRESGTVVAWGAPSSAMTTNVPGDLTQVIALAAGARHSLALRDDGTVVAWGMNNAGQTNVPAGLGNVVAIAAGGDSSLALKSDGTIVGWGTSLGDAPDQVVALEVGRSQGLALRVDGTVTQWSPSGQIQVVGVSNVVSLAAGHSHFVALRADGTLTAWGNGLGATGLPAEWTGVAAIDCATPSAPASWLNLALRGFVPRDFVPYATTHSPGAISPSTATLAGMVTANGVPSVAWFDWGADSDFGERTPLVDVGSGDHVVYVTAQMTGFMAEHAYHCRLVASNAFGVAYGVECLISTGTRLVTSGQDLPEAHSPPVPPGLTNVVAADGGRGHAIALLNDGTIRVWGQNDYHQTDAPPGLADITAVAAGGWHCAVLRRDGTVVAWGNNQYGQTNVPAGLSNVVAIGAGGYHTTALKADGTVAEWGGIPPVSGPEDLRDVTAISTSGDFTMALLNDGRVKEIGNGFRLSVSSVPPGLKGVTAIGAAVMHALAVKQDGSVVAWGESSYGVRQVPAGLRDVVSVSGGWYHSVALRRDGTAVAWGDDRLGQTNLFAGRTALAGIGSGDYFSIVLGPKTPPRFEALTAVCAINQELTVIPSCIDADGDPLTFRVVALPAAGSLFQWTPGGRGERIASEGQQVSAEQGRVIFVPALDESGAPYAAFSLVASDGSSDSAPGVIGVNVLPQPTLELHADRGGDGSVLELGFGGFSNATYTVWTATNLFDWTPLGTASQPVPGNFSFTNAAGTNEPQRFYRIRSP